MSIDVDDTDPSVVYSGSWSVLTGNSQQFQSTVHSTTQTGASATIKFHGTRIIVYQTVPMGDTTETVNSRLDGNTASINKHSHPGTTFFQDAWFDSGTLSDGNHILILSNGGGSSDTPFQLDRFNIQGSIIPPSPPVPPATFIAPVPKTVTKTAVATTTVQNNLVSSTSVSSTNSSSSVSSMSTSSSNSFSSSSTTSTTSITSTQTTQDHTVTAIQYITTSASASASTIAPDVTSSTSSKLPGGAIAGAVVGCIVLMLLMFGLCLRRRRTWGRSRRTRLAGHVSWHIPYTSTRRPTSVTPFDLENNASSGHLPTQTRADPEMTYGPNARWLAASNTNLLPSPTDQQEHASAEGTGTSDTNHTILSEKSVDYFSTWTTPSSNILPSLTSAAPQISQSSVHPGLQSTTLSSSRDDDASPYRPRYLSGDTLTAPPNNFGSNALAPIDSTDIPPSYQSFKSRNSNFIPGGTGPSMSLS